MNSQDTPKVRVTRIMSERREPLEARTPKGEAACQSTVGNWQFRRQCKNVGRYPDAEGYMVCASHAAAREEA